MKPFVIVSDSACALTKDRREKYDIDYVSLRILFEDKDLPADLDYGDVGYEEFFQLLKDGVIIKTAQANVPEYTEKFEQYVKEGKDVLYVGVSSALSGSFKCSVQAGTALMEKYPDSKIICLDTKMGGIGLGMLCITASILRSEGKTIEEVAEYIEAHKLEMNQLGTVDNLVYLKRSGRIGFASAFFGGLLQFKPIVISDVNGMNSAIEKVKGRKNSLDRVIEIFKRDYIKHPIYPKVHIINAVCEDAVEYIKGRLLEFDPTLEIEIDTMDPIVGCSTGPGMIALYFFGKEVTFDVSKK